MFLQLVCHLFNFHVVSPALHESVSNNLQWKVLVFGNIVKLFVAVRRLVVAFISLLFLLCLLSWE